MALVLALVTALVMALVMVLALVLALALVLVMALVMALGGRRSWAAAGDIILAPHLGSDWALSGAAARPECVAQPRRAAAPTPFDEPPHCAA
eukprot:scaffold113646_cov51-Phaeocystis_antarctica.AAC.1